MYKSLMVHYKNKYPDANVVAGDGYLDVFLGDRHMVALRKNGSGQMVCVSEEMGCEDRHDLAPIPRSARFRKLYSDGSIRNSEEHAERSVVARKLASMELGGVGKVPSCEDLKKAGVKLVSPSDKPMDQDVDLASLESGAKSKSAK